MPPSRSPGQRSKRPGWSTNWSPNPDANHAFFNDTGDRYNATAADDAWRRVQDWLTKYVG